MLKKLFLLTAVVFAPIGHSAYGVEPSWQMENCKAVYNHEKVKVYTDGRVSNKEIDVRLIFNRMLHTPPIVTLNNDEHQIIEVFGYGKAFSFALDYTPMAIAKLLPEGAGMVLNVTPVEWDENTNKIIENTQQYNLVVPTAGLPELVAELPQCNL